ncbi:Sortase family protein [Nocardioides dokdonensis FR1436]|uniref:Sortase family protein n=1 Tax=Nocardioides dokdonensis FR1436 TaxID=1300347 RepID=A0A1A9GK66_9ACTN|nr:class F sortase [Nocardioides dokdonensis]ANH38679.1 Sortase family protein [Nocardioides dokdonensis FR1436]
MAETSPARRTTSWVLTAAAVVLVGAGIVTWREQEPTPAGASEEGASAVGERALVSEAELPRPRRLARVPGSPRRLRVPALEVDVPVVAVGTRRDTLIPPTDPQQVGWWGEGAKPGAATGRALLAGHTVSSGGGALDDLETLVEGSEVVVTGDRGQVDYEVLSVRTFGKGRLAQQSERLFRQRGPGRLVLLTCEDWDGERYLSNVVVVARPTGRSSAGS